MYEQIQVVLCCCWQSGGAENTHARYNASMDKQPTQHSRERKTNQTAQSVNSRVNLRKTTNTPGTKLPQVPVGSWLEQSPLFAALAQQARQDGALQQDCLAMFALAGLVPSSASGQRRGARGEVPFQASLRGGMLLLNVSSAATANKIKHLSPRLCAGLVQRGWQVNAIRARVQPQLSRGLPAKKEANLSASGLSSWEQALPSIHDPALAEAITRLLRHHKNVK